MQIAGHGKLKRKRSRELTNLKESGEKGGLGVFSLPARRKRVCIGHMYQADIPALHYDSKERDDMIVNVSMLIVPCLYVHLQKHEHEYRHEYRQPDIRDTSSATELCGSSLCSSC